MVLPILGLAAVIALVVAYWLSAQHQRHATWLELCQRLELVSDPRDGQVAAGQFEGVSYRLRDTGSDWRLEVQLSRPLLPPGVVLFSVSSLRPAVSLRPLRLNWSSPRPPPSNGLYRYTDMGRPPSQVEVSLPFLRRARQGPGSLLGWLWRLGLQHHEAWGGPRAGASLAPAVARPKCSRIARSPPASVRYDSTRRLPPHLSQANTSKSNVLLSNSA
jgi:hypothetical protein